MSNSYDSGHPNLPFVGISSAGKRSCQPGGSKIDADHDHSDMTAILAVQILLNTIGHIAHNRG